MVIVRSSSQIHLSFVDDAEFFDNEVVEIHPGEIR